MDRTLIEAFAAGAPVPGQSIKGLTKQELNSFPMPGTWSIQQIVLHLMDSHLIAADRMKRIIAEDRPTLIGYDESAFARSLFYDRLDAAMAAEVFRMNQEIMADILRALPGATFKRVGVHNERGELTLASLVKGYVDHLEHHMTFLRRKRELLGKPL